MAMKRKTDADREREKKKQEERLQALAARPKQAAPEHPPFDSALQQLSRSLDDACNRNPCFRAWRLLQVGDFDSPRLFSQEAEAVFEELRTQTPDEPLIWHHLAIIRHGRAIEQHMANGACDVGLWRDGLEAWSKVIEDDRFWEALRGRWQSRAARQPQDALLRRLANVDLESVRRQLPVQLLDLHYDIILQMIAQQRTEVAKAHFELLSKAPFDPQLIEKVKEHVYRAIVGNTSVFCNERNFAEARRRVKNYRALDPASWRALNALLEIATAEINSLLIGGDNAQAAAVAWAEREVAEHPSLRQMPPGNDGETLRNTLRDFFFLAGRACLRAGQGVAESSASRAISFCEQAIWFCERAQKFGQREDQMRNLLNVVYHDIATYCLMERRLADAQRYIDLGLAHTPNDPDILQLQVILRQIRNR